jgi:hypothetical protein
VGFVFRIVGRRSPLHRSSRIRIHLQLSGQGRPETARTNPLGSSVNILPHPHDVRLNMTSVALKATLPPRLATRAIAVRHADENAKMASILLPRLPDLLPRRPFIGRERSIPRGGDLVRTGCKATLLRSDSVSCSQPRGAELACP